MCGFLVQLWPLTLSQALQRNLNDVLARGRKGVVMLPSEFEQAPDYDMRTLRETCTYTHTQIWLSPPGITLRGVPFTLYPFSQPNSKLGDHRGSATEIWKSKCHVEVNSICSRSQSFWLLAVCVFSVVANCVKSTLFLAKRQEKIKMQWSWTLLWVRTKQSGENGKGRGAFVTDSLYGDVACTPVIQMFFGSEVW